MCKKDEKAKYLAIQNKSLVEICESLEASVAKYDAEQGKINKQFNDITDQLTASQSTV